MKTIISAACMAILGLLAFDADASCIVLEGLPANIEAPGTYCLAQGHLTDITSGTLINIAANDVTLDCQGHTLRSTAASASGSSSAIVAFDRNNVEIRNCRIIGGFTHGINVSQDNLQPNRSYYNSVVDNYVAGPYMSGIIAFGSAIEVRGNRVYDIGGQLNQSAFGIRVGGSKVSGFKFQIVHDNRVAGTNSPTRHAYGIFSDGSVGTVFHENLVSGSSGAGGAYKGYGIKIASGAGNTITDNYLHDAGPGSDAVGVQTPSGGGVCYDNQIWAAQPTIGCNAGYGNY